MTIAFINGWKRYKLAYKDDWARSVRLIEFSIFHIPSRKIVNVRIALLGFAIEVVL